LRGSIDQDFEGGVQSFSSCDKHIAKICIPEFIASFLLDKLSDIFAGCEVIGVTLANYLVKLVDLFAGSSHELNKLLFAVEKLFLLSDLQNSISFVV